MARYSPSGHLAFVRGGNLMVAPFDLRQLKVTGPPVTVLENLMTLGNGAGHFSISNSGTLAYLSGGVTTPERTLVWVDRKGNAEPLSNETRAFDAPRLSPDGQRIAMQIAQQNEDIWQLDISRGVLTRVTTEDSRENMVVWCDKNRVVFGSDRKRRPHDLFWKSADGTGAADALLEIKQKPYPQFPQDCTEDGKLLFAEDHVLDAAPGLSLTGWDILMVPLSGERKMVPIVQTRFDEDSADVSPDSNWLAYVANESGRYEVYVQPFSGPGARVQISTDGGTEPRWSRNGRELFFRAGDKMMAVEVSPGLRVSRPRLLFQGPYVRTGHNPGYANYDVASDGRFVMIRSEKEAGPAQINVVLNWFEELKAQGKRPR